MAAAEPLPEGPRSRNEHRFDRFRRQSTPPTDLREPRSTNYRMSIYTDYRYFIGAIMPARDSTLARSSFLILLALSDRPRHGLGIIEQVEDASRGEVRMGPGTLYGTLQKLAADGLIRETATAPDPDDDDPRRRYYRLTPKGEKALKNEASRLRTLVDAVDRRRILEDV